MADKPKEEEARTEFDRLRSAAGQSVQDYKEANLRAAPGAALRGCHSKEGYGAADYLLYVEGKVANGGNVNCDVYLAKTEVAEAGGRVETGYWKSPCATRAVPV